jgi:hypothetical protein
MSWRSVLVRAVFSLPVLLAAPLLAQSTTETAAPPPVAASDTGPLKIHITAVRGAAQSRLPGETKWKTVTVGMDFVEGVEFRTGAHGVMQFLVGTDQVFRVDRLSVVKMLRANLMPDGTIRTNLGMTYGRVSKDVDQPSRPHEDTIVSPASTLAVRGTEVSLFDSPPYEPEAVSLTGRGILTSHLKGLAVPFGAKGEGTASITGDATGAAQSQLASQYVSGQGSFGQAPAGQAAPPPPPPPPSAPPVPVPPQQVIGQKSNMMNVAPSSTVSVATPGNIGFFLDWSSTIPQTEVDLVVISPKSDVISPVNPSSADGGMYTGSNFASATSEGETANYPGKEGITFGSTSPYTYPSGVYIIGAILLANGDNDGVGSANAKGSQAPAVTINGQLFYSQYSAANSNSDSSQVQLTGPSFTLTSTSTNPTPVAVFTVNTPASSSSKINVVNLNVPIPQPTTAAPSALRIKR